MASFHPFYDAVLEAAVDHARVRVMRTLLDTLNAPRDAVGGAARLGLSASARFRRSAARNRSALRRQRNSLTILPFYQRRRLPVEKRYPHTRTGWLAMNTGKQRWRIAACLAVVTPLLSVDIGQAEASHVDGTWMIRDLVLHIFDCQHAVCGRIVWIGDAARRLAQCGKTIVWGLEQKGPNEWTEGSILDPDDGNTYRLSATLESDGTLHARIFKGIPLFGRTEILKRVDVQTLTGRC